MAGAQRVTEAELDVLKVLWGEAPVTIRRITDRLYPEGGTAHYATVQKLLERLEDKGYVLRERQPGQPNLYRAAVERRQLIADRLRETADRLCEGSLTPLLTHLVDHADLTAEDVDELRAVVERLERDREKTR